MTVFKFKYRAWDDTVSMMMEIPADHIAEIRSDFSGMTVVETHGRWLKVEGSRIRVETTNQETKGKK